MTQDRQQLLDVLRAAIAAVHGRDCVRRHLLDAPVSGPVWLVAIGKAASAMALGTLDVLGSHVRRALVITKPEHDDPELRAFPQVDLWEGGHPRPDANSLRAGAELLSFLRRAPDTAKLVFCLSGGASSLVEVMPEGCTLAHLQGLNDWLLGSGLDIAAMNAVRQRFSCIKGGRLARYLNGRRARVLLISDVRGDDPSVIGSGLLVARPASGNLLDAVPDELQRLLDRAPPPPDRVDPLFNTVQSQIIATLDDARHAAAEAGATIGGPVVEHTEFVAGDAAAAGAQIADDLLAAAPALHVWGGETTVQLPAKPGLGGRNQHLALAAAMRIVGQPGMWILAAGTDGTDGPGQDAGALVDSGSLARGRSHGLDAARCLETADSGRFLEASGDLIHTGPTGTNVMDLILGLKRPRQTA